MPRSPRSSSWCRRPRTQRRRPRNSPTGPPSGSSSSRWWAGRARFSSGWWGGGTGLGAKRGILFKNALALEAAARIQTAVMDKTGTLTKGEPEVTELVADGLAESEVLRLVGVAGRETR